MSYKLCSILCQFLHNFFKYYFSKFLLFYLYNIFTVYFPSNSFLLNSCFLVTSNLSYLWTFILIFSRFFSYSHMLCFTMNSFHCTKYLVISLIFYLFSIFLIFYFSSHSLNTKSFILSITLSFFLHSSTSFFPLFVYFFISSCICFSAAPASFWICFILTANSVNTSYLG